ncbi:alpha/beta hydrolase family protein [Asticcacaulis tiandongensis]|uniref:S9 family peptidase n=1 Tax=Asticcacaulis tiandongensis TaxID=2565365 RepID=UPI00112BA1EA|nr:S9 family peptidase [Asticcacaulis tiandongensis]
MKPFVLSFKAACLATVLLTPLAQAEPLKPFTYQDMVSLDRMSGLTLDATGRYAAFQVRATDLEANRGVTSLWVKDVDHPQTVEYRLAISDGGAFAPQWGRDGALYFLSARSGSVQVWKTDLKGTKATQVTDLPLGVGSYKLSPDAKGLIVSLSVFPECHTDPEGEIGCTLRREAEQKASKTSGVIYDRLFVRHWDEWKDGTRNHLFYISFAGGEPLALTGGFDGDVPSKPFGDESEYSFSPDGRRVFFSGRVAGQDEPRSTNFDIYQIDLVHPQDIAFNPNLLRAVHLTNLTEANKAWDTGAVVSPDGRTLAYRAMKRPGFEADQFGIYLKDLVSGETRRIAADWDRSADSLEWSEDGQSLFVIAQDVGITRLFRIDVATQTVTPLSASGRIDAFAQKDDGFVFLKNSLNRPAQLYRQAPRDMFIDHEPQAMTQINNDVLHNRTFGAYEQFSFKGWNDETVYGYVIKPANFIEGKKYPIAFLIHGGPQGSFSDSWSYRWNPATYAGEGFAVVMIDFHGSTGYGQAFTDSITQHWGDRPLEDLQKGYAHALKAYPFLDADRACALGGSYGGYMVNWIASQWKDPWKCLVNHNGVFDTRGMGYATEELWFSEWENGGDVYNHAENYDKFNPALHAKDWSVPMLVIHSDNDFRVMPEQGIGTFTALQMNGVKSRMLRFPDENHWVLKPHNSLKWHQTVFDWLKEHTEAGQ